VPSSDYPALPLSCVTGSAPFCLRLHTWQRQGCRYPWLIGFFQLLFLSSGHRSQRRKHMRRKAPVCLPYPFTDQVSRKPAECINRPVLPMPKHTRRRGSQPGFEHVSQRWSACYALLHLFHLHRSPLYIPHVRAGAVQPYAKHERCPLAYAVQYTHRCVTPAEIAEKGVTGSSGQPCAWPYASSCSRSAFSE
jgi:hypothetical protein